MKFCQFLCMVVFFIGCQTISYQAQPKPLITLKPLQKSPENFKYITDVDFYWWGFSPGVSVVNLTEIAKSNGAKQGITNLRIREESTLLNFVYALITLGIYAPRHVEIYGVKITNNDKENQ